MKTVIFKSIIFQREIILVEINYIGYKTIAKNIDFTENKTENFSMLISVVEEDAIVVTGSSRASSIIRNPIPIVSINKKFLQQNLNTNIIDAIATVPGVSAGNYRP